ncbi:MAG: hypothetical protein HY904_11555 [Deltaproteobacteria bacterium]|nr:hypothetical protein [Deltaproteobacteria bacterium]
MSDWYKASTLVYWRQRVRERGADTYKAVLTRLDPEAGTLFERSLPMAWVDVAVAGRVLMGVGQVLESGHVNALYDMGRRHARDDMTGMYRALLLFTTIPFAVKQTARLWGTFHKHGVASTEHRPGDRLATVVIREYPELPRPIRENIAGFIAGILDVTGARGARVKATDADPSAWRFDASWDA